MTADSLAAQAYDLRAKAAFFVSQRRKDGELYGVLAECLTLCQTVENEGALEALKARYAERQVSDTRNRRYFETGADAALVVCRIVFEGGEKRRDACWRYTAVLREAAKRQIAGPDLAEWLRRNGGINALFVTRPVQARTVTTRTLHLANSVTVPKGGPFTLRLVRLDDGRYEVLGQEP